MYNNNNFFSAGVGRTGTFITIDSEMQRAEHEGELNPYQFVRQMRENRNHMVQTEVYTMMLQHNADTTIILFSFNLSFSLTGSVCVHS